MIKLNSRLLVGGSLVAILFAYCERTAAARQPNIVVILTDDQGYADISQNPHHAKEVSTPHMDALAKGGVVFTQGYTSGHVCSPTRAGLMLGQYQQRVGVYSAGDGGRGFDPRRPIFPSFLPDAYISTAIGKWHLGLDEDYPELKWHAMNRGFDECYKFMGRGGHSYFDLRSDSEGKFAHPIYRNKERINDEGYLTNRLSEEAVAFIGRNKARPFFLYLAYNAVHAPAEAPQADIEAFREGFPELGKERAILMAMLQHLDDGVGDVVAKLKEEELFDDTLLFFLTDNGGSKAMRADNTPLRGFKGSLDEGGIRTPFIVSWPSKFSGKRSIDTPVISLDILPTTLDAIGKLPAGNDFDGKSLLPLLTGKSKKHHDTLYWSKGGDGEWAVRRGDWKLHVSKGRKELINLADDPSERTDLASKNLEVVKALTTAFSDWIRPMADPITGGEKRADARDPEPDKPLTERQKERARIRAEKKKQREAERKATKTGPAAPQSAVVAGTLTGKVMVGYQGWFNCPGDGAQLGWKHWARDLTKPFAPGNVVVDLWPDVSELDPDELYATGFKHADGSPANVFSSANRKTVLRHFQWMRDYGIDGAFLQRFAADLSGPASLQNNNTLLSHVREGAKQSGRAFAVMYDLSGLRGGQVNRVRGDWMKLHTELNVASDEHYLQHNGKPLIAIWGVGFSDDRNYSLRECFELVKWMKSIGCSVMLGVPSFWRERKQDAVDDVLLHEIIKEADVVSPWTIGRYRNPKEASRHATKVWQPDREWCERENVDFLPVVFPGFSWHNLHGGKLDQIPRLKGEFFWSQVKAAKGIGCEMIYVAMFDEVDEATAIFKCTNIPPTADNAKFITYEGLPGDHYLKLTG
ncbi:MAG: sulfatase-like hydrolase/transferase, partial [Pirellulales bacterium]